MEACPHQHVWTVVDSWGLMGTGLVQTGCGMAALRNATALGITLRISEVQACACAASPCALSTHVPTRLLPHRRRPYPALVSKLMDLCKDYLRHPGEFPLLTARCSPFLLLFFRL